MKPMDDIKAMNVAWCFKITGHSRSMVTNVRLLWGTAESKSISIIAYDIKACSRF
jgi:hypothetical protein